MLATTRPRLATPATALFIRVSCLTYLFIAPTHGASVGTPTGGAGAQLFAQQAVSPAQAASLAKVGSGSQATAVAMGPFLPGEFQAEKFGDAYREYIRSRGLRCGLPSPVSAEFPVAPRAGQALAAPADCGLSSTTPSSDYDPNYIFDIPVVVHVIQDTNGAGFIGSNQVQAQIAILNEDFGAQPGSNGAFGFATGIQFRLATTDPTGAPTSGITYSTDTNWYNDTGSYWTTLAWDTNEYLNIYTNTASGFLGYVPSLPQTGSAGSTSDRVVILWTAFGRNAVGGAPYDQGRTATHEVGHYLGLYHTFNGGCAPTSTCNSSGDLICDTNAEGQPNYGCPTNMQSCGDLDPITNYMDYTDDLCMQGFTPEQSGRMRCTIEFYRPDLGITIGNDPDVDFMATPETGDAPLDVAFTDLTEGTGLVSWQWDFGDGNVSSAQDPTHQYTAPGTYDVSLTVVGSVDVKTEVKEDQIIVGLDVVASASIRLGSNINPNVYSATTLPVLGTIWTGTVDAASAGSTGAVFLLGYGGPAQVVTGLGELLLDPFSEPLLTLIAATVNGSSTHLQPVPQDNSLLGFAIYSQAILTSPTQLTNAVDLVLGT